LVAVDLLIDDNQFYIYVIATTFDILPGKIRILARSQGLKVLLPSLVSWKNKDFCRKPRHIFFIP
jgi:hypothetical protein